MPDDDDKLVPDADLNLDVHAVWRHRGPKKGSNPFIMALAILGVLIILENGTILAIVLLSRQ